MKSLDILKQASSYVGDSREKEYGNKLKNHDNIAKLGSAYKDIEFTARDVAVMMALLKIARTKQGKVWPRREIKKCLKKENTNKIHI